MSSCGKPDGQKDKSDRSGIPTLSQNQRRMGSLCRGPGTPPAITPSHNSVVNCLFHDVACPEAESASVKAYYETLPFDDFYALCRQAPCLGGYSCPTLLGLEVASGGAGALDS
jgi:hypothetical protein